MKKIILVILLPLIISACETVEGFTNLFKSSAELVDVFTDEDNQKSERFLYQNQTYNILYKKQDEFHIVKVWPNLTKGFQTQEKNLAEAVAKTFVTYTIIVKTALLKSSN
jgi:DNA-directed RNA polymerase